MSNDPSNADPQGETPNGTAPTPATGTPGTGETPGTATDDAKQIEDLKAALKKANAESAAHRHKAKELDDLKAKLEADKLSESEKLQKQLTDLQAQHDAAKREAQETRVNSAIQLHALQAGIDPTLASKLISRAEVETDDAGNPTNVDALLKALAKQYPMLVGKAPPVASGGATTPPRSQSGAPPVLSWDVIGKLTPTEYAARGAEIQAWIAANPYRFGQRR